MLTPLHRGLGAAGRQPLLAAPLYLLSLLLALGPTIALGLLAGDRPWLPTVLGPDWANQAVELVGATVAARPGGDPGGRLGVVAGPALAILLAGLALVLQGLGYSFLAGGILERLRGGSRVSFWAGCRRWFCPFVRLGLLGGPLFALLALGWLLASSVFGADPAAILAGSGLLLLNGWLELARANMVARGERVAAGALGRASRGLLRRRLPSCLAAWLVLGLAGLALLSVQAWALEALDPPPDQSPIGLIVPGVIVQALLFAGGWLKVARLATALELDGSSHAT